MNHYQWVHGIAVNDVIAADAVHPLVNCGQNTPIADSILFNIEQKAKIKFRRSGRAGAAPSG
jgi:hypothetical protein